MFLSFKYCQWDILFCTLFFLYHSLLNGCIHFIDVYHNIFNLSPGDGHLGYSSSPIPAPFFVIMMLPWTFLFTCIMVYFCKHIYRINLECAWSFKHLKIDITGLPWWHSGWESACRCRGHGFEPWSGKSPHAAEQLGPWAIITEPACLEPVLRYKRGRDNERPAHRDEEWPPLATTRESPCTETKTQHSHK